MNMKTYQVLKYLSDNNFKPHTVKELSNKFDVSDRMIRNYISYIENFLSDNNICLLYTSRCV